jgi:hypothetical protein
MRRLEQINQVAERGFIIRPGVYEVLQHARCGALTRLFRCTIPQLRDASHEVDKYIPILRGY